MRRRGFVLALAALVAAPPLAAQAAETEVKITADSFVVDDATRSATFTGNVVVVRADLTVWAPKVVVDYGEDGPSSIRSFIASGGVRLKTSAQDATGDRAVYDPSSETLRLTGNVMVVNATGTVGGQDMLVNLRTNTTTFSSGSGGRVTGVFSTQ
jgi:lipopolysaccharide export system protein LptA